MESANFYNVQALFKDTLEYFSVAVAADDPAEAEAIVRLQAVRELLIASVMRIPAPA